MIHDDLLDLLESRIYQALKKIAELQQKVNTLIHEKEELERHLSSRDDHIAQLESELREAENSTDALAIAEYREKENKVKDRLQDLVNKIDKVRLLE